MPNRTAVTMSGKVQGVTNNIYARCGTCINADDADVRALLFRWQIQIRSGHANRAMTNYYSAVINNQLRTRLGSNATGGE
jgi:hypothetical protein